MILTTLLGAAGACFLPRAGVCAFFFPEMMSSNCACHGIMGHRRVPVTLALLDQFGNQVESLRVRRFDADLVEVVLWITHLVGEAQCP